MKLVLERDPLEEQVVAQVILWAGGSFYNGQKNGRILIY
jgi:hypothetical protein